MDCFGLGSADAHGWTFFMIMMSGEHVDHDSFIGGAI
jgi:hypothetical protein